MNSVADVWTNVLQQLKKDLSETTITTWFDELTAVDIRENTFYLHCPNDFKKRYIESLFIKNIKAALQDLFSMEFEVKILDEGGLLEFQGGAPKKNSDRFTYEDFTFETFVVGPSNKLAYAASMAVAEHPAQNYNPLLIYGDSGLGKTHLLYAIAHLMRSRRPESRIVYIKGDQFTNELIAALQEGRNNEFRYKYRNADLFLVDDIQFIAGKESTQEEFFHTFNNLYENHHQIVLTADRPPNEMLRLEDRLKTRFEWGLIADIQPPDYETRMAILKKNAESYNKEISEEIFDYIASNIKSNIRELEGAFNKVIAYSKLNKVDITLDIVIETLKDLISPNKVKQVTPELIINTVAEHYGVKPEDIKSPKRNSEFVLPRQVYMYVASKLTVESQQNIGKYINKKDHTTIIHGINKISTKLETDEELRNNVEIIMKKLNPH